ncbi:MAG: response regulator [Patiriisocius sp.]|uniref:response regulator n=1 Tax=Patiriisocius sp. TaxID=2822396 RepID=UPI003EF61B41
MPKGSGIVLSKRILAIEDNQTSQILFMKQFIDNDEGFMLELAKNGTQAKELLSRKKYAAVIIKSQLEDMDAQTFMDFVNSHKDSNIKNTAIIVATGSTMINEKQYILESGATAFLAKPYSKKDLFKILKRL